MSTAQERWHALVTAESAPRVASAQPTRVSDDRKTAMVLPFGRSKGRTVSEADTKDLTWMLGVLRESIADESKARWRIDNQLFCDTIESELAER